jgi:hypothetical protein
MFKVNLDFDKAWNIWKIMSHGNLKVSLVIQK